MMRRLATATGASPLLSVELVWKHRSYTAHPLGGCTMANDGTQGSVNARCQLFSGPSTNTHAGLYVVDGAVIPRALLVNPLLTITANAERVAAQLQHEPVFRDLFG